MLPAYFFPLSDYTWLKVDRRPAESLRLAITARGEIFATLISSRTPMNQTYLTLLGLTIDTEAPMVQTVANCSRQASVKANNGKRVNVSFDVTSDRYCVNIADADSQYHLKYAKYGKKLTDVIQLVDQQTSQVWGR